jgi:hypothetical protein
MRRTMKFNFARSYFNTGKLYWSKIKFYNPQKTAKWYTSTLSKYNRAVFLNYKIDVATTPYYNQELMSHVKTHLPDWKGFKTEYHTYIHAEWSSIYADWDWSTAKLVLNEERALLQRDRLMQIFQACPPGSYGYYAQYGLAPFKAVVGSFASATIDEFFASMVQFLKQPFSVPINDIMSTLETRYWNTRKELLDYLAGKTFTKRRRELGVSVPASVMTIWEGKRVPQLPAGETLSDEQLAEVQKALTEENLDKLDDIALARFTADLYKQLVAKGKANPDGGTLPGL